jgi:lambda family phage portal protein
MTTDAVKKRGRPLGSRTKPTDVAQAVQAVTGPVVGAQARYDAAGTGRRMRGWNPPSSGPNVAIRGLQNIRNRSRDAVRNDWAGESSVQKWATNLVGIGITPRFKRVKNATRKQEIVDLWNDWVRIADADGVLNLYGLQTLVVRSWFESGEVFGRLRSRAPELGLPVPLQIQLIEADYVPLFDADSWPGLPVGNRIRQGIELNKYNRRVAYWMYKEHPGDALGVTPGQSDLIRIPADQVMHVFEPKRPGQLRGVAGLASVLARLRSIGDYEDAVLEKQKLSNLFVAFLKTVLPPATENTDPYSGLPLQYGSKNEPLASLEPGIFQELDAGQEVQFSNPPESGTMYSEYMRTSHLGTAAGSGMPYEILTGDIKDVSDRTLRVIINEFRRLAEQRQWQVIIPMFCEPIAAAFATAGALIGALSLEEVDAVKRAEWAPHGWAYIHPVQDPQGKKMEVDAGFRSRSSVIGERGDDPDAVDQERADDLEREKGLDLWVDPNPPPAAPAATDPTEEDAQAAPNKPTKK